MSSAPATSNLCGDAPQIIVTRARSTTASPTVTSTTDSTGSPSIGRMIRRSHTRPSTAPTHTASSTAMTPPVPIAMTSDQVV